MKNKRKHVLILGGSSDIGIEVVKNFLWLKWEVTAHFNKNKKRLEILKKGSKNLNIVKLNFTPHKNLNIEKLLIKKFNGRYDSVINLVGYIDNIGYRNTNFKSIWQTVSINAIFPILLEKKLVKSMISQKWGRILNCSSIGIKFGGGINTFNYSFSKHCLEFIPGVHKSWARRNVFINNLRIGVTDTKLHKKIKNLDLKKRVKLIPINRMARPNEIANYITDLTTDTNSYMTGETITVAGGE